MPDRAAPERGLLTGKVALVTGGSRGLGQAIAEAFAGARADVVIASRKHEAVEQAPAKSPIGLAGGSSA